MSDRAQKLTMKILVTGLSDPHYAPMLRGFLNYYLPEDSQLFCSKNDAKPSKVSLKLMDSVGIDISKRLSQPVGDSQISEMDVIISTTAESSHFLDQQEFSPVIQLHHLHLEEPEHESEKELKKALKKERKQLQKFSEQLLEKVES